MYTNRHLQNPSETSHQHHTMASVLLWSPISNGRIRCSDRLRDIINVIDNDLQSERRIFFSSPRRPELPPMNACLYSEPAYERVRFAGRVCVTFPNVHRWWRWIGVAVVTSSAVWRWSLQSSLLFHPCPVVKRGNGHRWGAPVHWTLASKMIHIANCLCLPRRVNCAIGICVQFDIDGRTALRNRCSIKHGLFELVFCLFDWFEICFCRHHQEWSDQQLAAIPGEQFCDLGRSNWTGLLRWWTLQT